MSLKSQEWAPVGSKWIYSYYLSMETEPVYDYLFYESVKDTFIEGKTVRKIHFQRNSNTNGMQLLRTEFLYMEDKRVYFYKWDQFNLLYDFNLQVNDSYTVQDVDNQSISGLFTCTNKVTFNGYNFYELGGSDNLYFGAEVLEHVGSMKDFFPTDEAVFPPEYKRLRCYITADTLYYQEEDWEIFCDHFRTLKLTELELNGLQFSPNPLSELSTLEIPAEFGAIGHISVYSLNGQENTRYELKERKISLRESDFVPGVYFIRVETEEQRLFGKFVVE